MRFAMWLFALVLSVPALSQEGYAAYERGDALMNEGKPAEALPFFERAAKAYPRHTAMWSAVARAAAASGRHERSLDALETIATLGGAADLKAEPLSKLPASSRLSSIEMKFRENATPISVSRVVAVIPDRELIPESIAYDAKDGAYYAGVMLYERRDGAWKGVGNVSTFER